jgi:2-C-methyl-D-erythritol 4-phosphate cytidylyltransferase
MRQALIVVAAGGGQRLGQSIDKPYVELEGRPLVWHCLKSLDAPGLFHQRIVVVAPNTENRFRDEILKRFPLDHPIRLIPGGETRQVSVRSGLAAVAGDIEIVAIHDGARSLIDEDTVRATFHACQGVDGSLVALPVQEALKRVDSDLVVGEVSRIGVWRAQTPQTFWLPAIRAAHEAAWAEGIEDADDDASLVTRRGGRVRVIQGTKVNLKITVPEDLKIAGMLLRERQISHHDL